MSRLQGRTRIGSSRQQPWAALRLRSQDVDLWRAELDEQPDELVAWLERVLSDDERERAAKFYFARDRRRFTTGRGLLRVLLARYLGMAPAEIAFRYGPNGKPELERDDRGVWSRTLGMHISTPLHFNLAHSEGLALFAFTRVGAVGVDVERIRDLPDWEHIAATCFSASERGRVYAAETELRPVEFFRAWTRQEARLKATGEGLGGAMRPLDAEPYTDGLNPAFAAPAASLPVYALQVATGYAAALAVSGGARWATCFTWDHLQWTGGNRPPRSSRRIPLAQSAETGIGFL